MWLFCMKIMQNKVSWHQLNMSQGWSINLPEKFQTTFTFLALILWQDVIGKLRYTAENEIRQHEELNQRSAFALDLGKGSIPLNSIFIKKRQMYMEESWCHFKSFSLCRLDCLTSLNQAHSLCPPRPRASCCQSILIHHWNSVWMKQRYQ